MNFIKKPTEKEIDKLNKVLLANFRIQYVVLSLILTEVFPFKMKLS